MDMSGEVVLENLAGAFLKRGGQYLLMKRSKDRKIAPNVWSCVGGKFAHSELNNPLTACLREICEETGISEEHIYDLELRYIIIRRAENIIRQNYIYFGQTDAIMPTGNGEGTLHWIPEAELLYREYSKTYEAMLRHYLYAPDKSGRVVVGIASNDNGGLHMNWAALEDFQR